MSWPQVEHSCRQAEHGSLTCLDQAWSSLGKRADQRKAKLGDSHDLQRFLSDFRYGAEKRLCARWESAPWLMCSPQTSR